MLQIPVLILLLPQPPQLADAKPATQLLPSVECPLRNPHPAQNFSHRRFRIGLPRSIGNLLFAVTTLLYGTFLAPKGDDSKKLSFKPEEKQGGRQATKMILLVDYTYTAFDLGPT